MTYVAQLVEVSEQIARLSEHEMSLHLNFLQRLHETLHINGTNTCTRPETTPSEKKKRRHIHDRRNFVTKMFMFITGEIR